MVPGGVVFFKTSVVFFKTMPKQRGFLGNPSPGTSRRTAWPLDTVPANI